MLQGLDGNVVRARSINRSGTITLTLQQTSTSNSILQLYLDSDEAVGDGATYMAVRDWFGNDGVRATYAWIRKPPTLVYSTGIEAREWIIDCQGLYLSAAGANLVATQT